MDSSLFSSLAPSFKEALCPNEIGFTDDGYLSPCFTNTYIFSPIALALAIWGIAETKSLKTNGHAANTLTGRINFVLTCLYTVVNFLHGPNIFNVIASVSSMISLAIIFVLSFLDLKGVAVPRKPLEVYFFLAAAVSGYYVVQFIGTKYYGPGLLSAVYICMISSLAGSARNIISAFDDAQSQVRTQKAKSE